MTDTRAADRPLDGDTWPDYRRRRLETMPLLIRPFMVVPVFFRWAAWTEDLA